MEIIRHSEKKNWYDLKIYRTECSCGCVFKCNEYEFTRERTPNGKVLIRCPDCGKTIYKENMKEIINSNEG